MKLRGLDKIDYRETRRNKKRGASTAPKVGNSTAAGQRRTASGRVTRTVLATTKRCAGRPPKSPAKLSPGRPRKQRAEPTPVNAPSVIPKKSSRRSMRREYQPASPIVKIVKQTPALAPEDSSDAEHHAVLMHKFFRAHGKEVANSPKKKQRKALGKLWRESPLNPKNARVQQDYESANGAPGNGDDDRDVDEEVGEGSAGDEAKIDDEDEHSTM